MSDRNRGLHAKYVVERSDGSSEPGGKHAECDYFVLDWAHDPYAIPAALAYADACESTHPFLARDLRRRADMAKKLAAMYGREESTESPARGGEGGE